MLSEIYAVIKPDAFERNVDEIVLRALQDGCRQLSVKLFCPTASEIVSIYPHFMWQLDVLDDWIELFCTNISVLVKLQESANSIDEWARIKGKTFNPSPTSLRGKLGVSTRVSNAIHLPANALENQALGLIFRGNRKTTSFPQAKNIARELKEQVFGLEVQAILSRLWQRVDLLGLSTQFREIFRLFGGVGAGSKEAFVLTQNFETMLRLHGVPHSRSEIAGIRQGVIYFFDDRIGRIGSCET